MIPINDYDYAMLCACYDIFGCTRTEENLSNRSRNIKLWASPNGDIEINKSGRVKSEIESRLSVWANHVKHASLGLVAIHGFKLSGSGSGKGYYQRHGIEKASTIIGGGKVFGACHFDKRLPDHTVAVLAAKNGRTLQPDDYLNVTSTKGIHALVRLFRA